MDIKEPQIRIELKKSKNKKKIYTQKHIRLVESLLNKQTQKKTK